ncbi:hypothetical protein ABZ783_22220 [Micromonospora sp. NPDC047738]|uniref:hypothetical protein n=1 Tax=Micromonospora sp. NPDC047738 TaxID=3155741 RepID=UPI0033F106C8
MVFDPDWVFCFETIELGSNGDLGYRPMLIAAPGGSGSVATSCSAQRSPQGREPLTDIVGRPMISVGNQPEEQRYDREVAIEEHMDRRPRDRAARWTIERGCRRRGGSCCDPVGAALSDRGRESGAGHPVAVAGGDHPRA